MSGYAFQNGVTGVCLRVKLNDSSQTIPNNKGITGLTIASAGLIISTLADGESATTNYTQAGGTLQTIATLGTYAAPSASNARFKEVDSTNQPGVYEIQLLNARWAVANAKWLQICIPAIVGLNLAQMDLMVPLWSINPYDAVRAGLTALPNVVSGSAGAIPTTGMGANQINVSGGRADANVLYQAGAAVKPRYIGTAQTGGASNIVLAAGTTSGQCVPGDQIEFIGAGGQGESGIVATTSGMGGASPIAVMVQPWQFAAPDGTTIYEITKTGGLVPLVVTSVAGRPDINVGSVNGTKVNGSGTSGSPWGP